MSFDGLKTYSTTNILSNNVQGFIICFFKYITGESIHLKSCIPVCLYREARLAELYCAI